MLGWRVLVEKKRCGTQTTVAARRSALGTDPSASTTAFVNDDSTFVGQAVAWFSKVPKDVIHSSLWIVIRSVSVDFKEHIAKLEGRGFVWSVCHVHRNTHTHALNTPQKHIFH